VDGRRVERAKPDPEVFITAASDLGIPPESCVVFEDAEAGIEAGKRAGMGTVGVGDPLMLNQADIILRGLDQLMALTFLREKVHQV
jgi:beta-phosphoglucomutase